MLSKEVCYRRNDVKERLGRIRVMQVNGIPEAMIIREISIARALFASYRQAVGERKTGCSGKLDARRPAEIGVAQVAIPIRQ